MDLREATPLLTQHSTCIVSTITPSGRVQSTVVSSALLNGKLCIASRGRTVKVRNIERTGRATATVLNLENRRYVTVEGPATVRDWPKGDTSKHVNLLKDVYTAMGRAPKVSDAEFAKTMAEEQRMVIEITPERIYGSLSVR